MSHPTALVEHDPAYWATSGLPVPEDELDRIDLTLAYQDTYERLRRSRVAA